MGLKDLLLGKSAAAAGGATAGHVANAGNAATGSLDAMRRMSVIELLTHARFGTFSAFDAGLQATLGCLSELAKSGADLNATTVDGRSALALCAHSEALTKRMLDLGADPSHPNPDPSWRGRTPFHELFPDMPKGRAMTNIERTRMVGLYMKAGAQPEDKNHLGQTVLQVADLHAPAVVALHLKQLWSAELAKRAIAQASARLAASAPGSL